MLRRKFKKWKKEQTRFGSSCCALPIAILTRVMMTSDRLHCSNSWITYTTIQQQQLIELKQWISHNITIVQLHSAATQPRHILSPSSHSLLSFWRKQWIGLIQQCFTSPPTQYRLYGRRFLQVKRPNQQYQSTEGTNSTQTNQTHNKQTGTQNTASTLVYNNMGVTRGWLPQRAGCRAWTAVGLLPR